MFEIWCHEFLLQVFKLKRTEMQDKMLPFEKDLFRVQNQS